MINGSLELEKHVDSREHALVGVMLEHARIQDGPGEESQFGQRLGPTQQRWCEAWVVLGGRPATRKACGKEMIVDVRTVATQRSV